ncbi:hypothetical protein QQS21_011784 [Conoideocrella luteorostrata]|uniref:Uncharacterized protein n=1 Tax=Conoideocrella luteorostrata TaxID=1105319 RepID=A0AAJ0FT14_9HYPO|nr:hypothetical protein QQS21_011784 [Conoideocrella luteorostrata]
MELHNKLNTKVFNVTVLHDFNGKLSKLGPWDELGPHEVSSQMPVSFQTRTFNDDFWKVFFDLEGEEDNFCFSSNDIHFDEGFHEHNLQNLDAGKVMTVEIDEIDKQESVSFISPSHRTNSRYRCVQRKDASLWGLETLKEGQTDPNQTPSAEEDPNQTPSAEEDPNQTPSAEEDSLDSGWSQ